MNSFSAAVGRPSHALLFVLLLSSTALCLPLILLQRETPYTMDESKFYLPAIRQIHATWPRVDLVRDSNTATAPGYPYLLATLGFLTGTSRLALRLLNLGVSMSLLPVLWFAWPADTRGLLRFAALAPLAACCFFIRSASNVMTDNAALLTATGALAMLLIPRLRANPTEAGAIVAIGVFCRQITIWLEAPLVVSLLWIRGKRYWLAPLCPLVVLGVLVLTWGGLVPPAWQSEHAGLGYAAGVYQLALICIFGAFYYSAACPDWRDDFSSRWTWLGALVGLLFAVANPTAPSYAAGRWGGYLWTAAEHMPSVGQRSLLFLVLSPLGGAMLVALVRHLWRAAGRQSTALWLVAVLAFLATGLFNRQIHHRYYEPTLIVLLVFWCILQAPRDSRAQNARLLPLILLGAFQLVVTLITAYGRTFGLL